MTDFNSEGWSKILEIFPDIDFTKEPYKSMVDQTDPEYSKRMIRTIVSFVGEPDEKGNFKITKEDLDNMNQMNFGHGN